MPSQQSRIPGCCILLLLAVMGGSIGGLFSTASPTFDPNACPLPYHVPKYPGVASLRLAMVHDVLTERYPKHGSAYYEERNRLTRLAMEAEARRMGDKPSAKYFELTDDLAAGLDHLGKHAESIALMRDKLKRQLELGQQGMELYSTYANLGTFIILWEIHEGLADKAKARAGLEEGIKLIHQAIDINPRSHFGREIWQVVILEYLLAMLDDPELVLKFDMAGNSLQAGPAEGGHTYQLLNGRGNWSYTCRDAHEYLEKPVADQDAVQLQGYRWIITKIAPAKGWDLLKTSHKVPVAFDEPTLGIIGMWRLGGGPNPFFAVGLGEIMNRVGQNYIAWAAFERAWLLGDAVGPEPIRTKFKENCRARQEFISTLITKKSPGDAKQLKPSFDVDLAKGLAYQNAYQEFEAARIKEGAAIDAADFYDAFHAKHGNIASPVGAEDRILSEDISRRPGRAFSFGAMVLGAGIGAFLGALLVRMSDWTIKRNRFI